MSCKCITYRKRWENRHFGRSNRCNHKNHRFNKPTQWIRLTSIVVRWPAAPTPLLAPFVQFWKSKLWYWHWYDCYTKWDIVANWDKNVARYNIGQLFDRSLADKHRDLESGFSRVRAFATSLSWDFKRYDDGVSDETRGATTTAESFIAKCG